MADFETLKGMIISGDGDGAKAQTEAMIAEGKAAKDILNEALLPGMDVVGAKMKSGECFIPEVLLSARTMQGALDILKPLIAEGGEELETVVIGTVEGDMHDIGKNLVAMLLEGAGFNVINLGKGITPAEFVAAVKDNGAKVVGMSGLLTTTIPKMSETIDAMKDAGVRDGCKVICGGAPVSPEFCDEIGADAYGPNAAMGVDRVKELVGA